MKWTAKQKDNRSAPFRLK